jgi:hypothetical protein
MRKSFIFSAQAFLLSSFYSCIHHISWALSALSAQMYGLIRCGCRWSAGEDEKFTSITRLKNQLAHPYMDSHSWYWSRQGKEKGAKVRGMLLLLL